MTKWPARIPHDLKMKLEELAERRYAESDQDRWAAIKEWLEKHSVQAPERLPQEPELKNEWNWLDDANSLGALEVDPAVSRSPSALELRERKRITAAVRETVRRGEGVERLADHVDIQFSHLDFKDREEILRIVRNSLLNLTSTQDVIYDLEAHEINDWLRVLQ